MVLILDSDRKYIFLITAFDILQMQVVCDTLMYASNLGHVKNRTAAASYSNTIVYHNIVKKQEISFNGTDFRTQ